MVVGPSPTTIFDLKTALKGAVFYHPDFHFPISSAILSHNGIFTTGVRKMGKKVTIKLETGTVYQKDEGGTYYFRYQVRKERKCVSLKTQN